MPEWGCADYSISLAASSILSNKAAINAMRNDRATQVQSEIK